MGEDLDYGFELTISDATRNIIDGDANGEGDSTSPLDVSYAHTQAVEIDKDIASNAYLPSDNTLIPVTRSNCVRANDTDPEGAVPTREATNETHSNIIPDHMPSLLVNDIFVSSRSDRGFTGS
ncbi:hypothetical protein OBBRIDRAFT_795864 [Obba rivulosa]|uniref:Uncharacterized protein n=1 Tax=Obba rivulosa TaxID=1052685 RepID=A0A8E2DIB4_9APHY|nr:hypothetical protein OBBRIDRAFT_795864 [Obba rivulosa]